MSAQIVSLDVRDDIRSGHDPFSRILQAVAGLKVGDQLRLLAPFKPVPLLAVMERRGFTHQARPAGGTDWEVLFTRTSVPVESAPLATAGPPACGGCGGAAVVELDARGLEPPEPLIRILEALESLPAGAELRVWTDRRPIHLGPHLDERGFVAQHMVQRDGSCLTHIRRG